MKIENRGLGGGNRKQKQVRNERTTKQRNNQ